MARIRRLDIFIIVIVICWCWGLGFGEFIKIVPQHAASSTLPALATPQQVLLPIDVALSGKGRVPSLGYAYDNGTYMAVRNGGDSLNVSIYQGGLNDDPASISAFTGKPSQFLNLAERAVDPVRIAACGINAILAFLKPNSLLIRLIGLQEVKGIWKESFAVDTPYM